MSRVLVACEFSGVVRRAFRDLGDDAWSCDLLPAEDGSPHHIQGDVLEHLEDGWDMMIHHAPCTYLLLAGVRWLYQDGKRYIDGGENELDAERWQKLLAGVIFFKALQNCDIPRICGENPKMCSFAESRIGYHTQSIQLCEFGEPQQKETWLWLKNLPPLVPTKNVRVEMMALPRKERERVHFMSPGPQRQKERSRFFPSVAAAMAIQWGCL